jgi:hypothetical protein
MKLFLAAAAIGVVASNVYDGNMTFYLAEYEHLCYRALAILLAAQKREKVIFI